MSVMLLGRQFFPHVVYFIGVGLMADKSSRIELILKNSFDACVLPQDIGDSFESVSVKVE